LPPERADRLPHRRRLDAQPACERAREFAQALRQQDAERREARQHRERRVLAHRAAQDRPFGLAILGDEADAGRDRLRRRTRRDAPPVDLDRAGAARPRAEERAQRLAAPRADQPREADHLARAHVEVDPFERGPARLLRGAPAHARRPPRRGASRRCGGAIVGEAGAPA
jgi:hypothetical protein